MSPLLLATTNPGKQREFRRLLAAVPGDLVLPQDLGLELEVPEPHASYADNASAKALAFCRASGLPALADDSGIEVAALGWGPGVHSARFEADSGRDRADLLLDRLAGVTDRQARMVCWLALATPPGSAAVEPQVELFHGVVEGEIALRRRGAGGFGYDPIFQLPTGRTTAELSAAEKDGISHRGRAVAAALPHIREQLAIA